MTIPVVANGDIDTPEAMRACAMESGCRSFMIGRGSMGRPHLFQSARGRPVPDFDRVAFVDLLLAYCERLLDAGAGDRGTLGRLKQWLRLGAPAFAEIAGLFDTIKRCSTLAAAKDVLLDRRNADSAAA